MFEEGDLHTWYGSVTHHIECPHSCLVKFSYSLGLENQQIANPVAKKNFAKLLT